MAPFVFPPPDGCWTVTRGGRGFQTAVEYLTQFEANHCVLCYSHGIAPPVDWDDPEKASLELLASDITVIPAHAVHQFRGLIKARFTAALIEEFHIDFHPGFAPQRSDPPAVEVDGAHVPNLCVAAIGRIFSDFWEQQLPGIRARFGTAYESWPPFLTFCRIVRNASSHLGRVTINNPKAPEGAWYGLRIGPANHGELLIGGVLLPGDLILLLRDLVLFLNHYGTPHSPEDLAQGSGEFGLRS